MARFERLHDWPDTPREAIELQKQLRSGVRIVPLEGPVETIAGADISYNKYETTLYAGIVVLRIDTLEVVEEVGVIGESHFPYVPGLLSFREIPPVLEAWGMLKSEPDAVMLDGHGIAHPRRFGIASHLGVIIGRPAFGCGKSVLVGRYEEPAAERGSWSPMIDRNEVIGGALRTKNRVKPIYVSPGHLIDLPAALALTLACDGGYRQPEPTRRAHLLVNALRRGERDAT